MKYEKFWEIQNSMRAVTINSEFSLPGLRQSDLVQRANANVKPAINEDELF